jgi:hypothetical protein
MDKLIVSNEEIKALLKSRVGEFAKSPVNEDLEDVDYQNGGETVEDF